MRPTLPPILLPLLLILAVPAAGQVCGDCTADGNTDILDALFIASVGAGIQAADPAQRDSCDVDLSGGDLNILDALVVARHAAGLVQAYSCVFAPNTPPVATYVSPQFGTFQGVVDIEYTVADPEGDVVNVEIRYTHDWGISWHVCTPTAQSGPTQAIPADPGGTTHFFQWDINADVPMPGSHDTRFVITPSDGFQGSSSVGPMGQYVVVQTP